MGTEFFNQDVCCLDLKMKYFYFYFLLAFTVLSSEKVPRENK